MEQKNENIGLIILLSCVATIGGFLFGFDSGVINGTVDGLQQAFNSDTVGTGFNVSSILLGAAGGAFFAGNLADKFGRRLVLIVAAMLFLVSAWGSGVATSSFEFVVYRIIGGLAVGAASVMAPAYISEIAPARIRGTLASIQQFAIVFGLFSAFLSNYLLADVAGGSTEVFWMDYQTWRWMYWVEILPAAVFLFALLLVPESPRFLALSGNKDKALNVLKRLYGDNSGEQKYTEIVSSIEEQQHKPTLFDVIDKKTNKIMPVVWVGIGLAAFQQLVGINVVFYYGAVLWQAAGFSEADALMNNVITGGVSIAAVFLTMYLIDKVGRRPFLLVGSIGMTITLAIIVFVFANAEVDGSGNLQLGEQGVIALIGALVYVFFFNMSWGTIMWVMLGEMFPNQIRGSGLAIAGLTQWLANFLIIQTFPSILASDLGLTGAYSIYLLGAIVSFFFVYKFVYETKGLELEEMRK